MSGSTQGQPITSRLQNPMGTSLFSETIINVETHSILETYLLGFYNITGFPPTSLAAPSPSDPSSLATIHS